MTTPTVDHIFEHRTLILLVEDNPTDAELVEAILTEEFDNLRFERVDTASELRRQLSEFNPQMILSDYSIPGFSGLEALHICQEMKPETPFIFVSGTIGEERAVEALKNGAVDYVLKDSLARLPHAVKQALAFSREQRHKKRQQQELIRAYDLLNSVFDNTHMMVAYLDTDFNVMQSNRSFGDLAGIDTHTNIRGKKFFDFVSGGIQFERQFGDVIDTGKSRFEFETVVEMGFDLNNRRSLIIDWSLAMTGSFGSVDGLVFTAVDVSKKIELQQENLDVKQRFNDALNHAPDPILITNGNGEIFFFNQMAEKAFGYPHQEIIGKKIEVLIPDRYTKGHAAKRQGYIKRPEARPMGAAGDLCGLRKDGSEFPVDITLGPLKMGSEKGVMAVVRDVTERKKREAELKQLSLVASRVDNAVFVGDRFFYPIWINEAFEKQTGYNLDDLQDKKPAEIFAGEQGGLVILEEMMDQLERGNYVNQELILRTKNGNDYWASIHATPVMNNSGELEQILAIINNISKRKKAEIQRDELLNTLEQKVEERTDELQTANLKLKEWNRDISDSISYAKYIQDAFIPDFTAKALGLKKAFAVDMPKDVLSGDFHWGYKCPDTGSTYLALGDCTGHGVPGAMMTMLAVQLLEHNILLPERQQPSEILSRVDSAMISFLNKKDGEVSVNDGMEVVVVRIDPEKKQITFSNAGRPLYRYRKGSDLMKFGHNRLAVGGVEKDGAKVFIQETLEFEPGDRFYVFSDGYADQFGGPDKRKLLRRRKEQYLLAIQQFPLAKHGKLLKQFFLDWKGDNFQIDDVMILGFEL